MSEENFTDTVHNPDVSNNAFLLNQKAVPLALPHAKQIAEFSTVSMPIFSAKGWLSLNWHHGCSFGCAYCYRNNRIRPGSYKPTKVYDEETVADFLFSHPYFVPSRNGNSTEFPPSFIGLHTSSTEAFAPEVVDSTFKMLSLLDDRGITNPVIIITKWFLDEDQIRFLEDTIKNIRLFISVCYSGIDESIEPVSEVSILKSRRTFLRRLSASKVITPVHYFRPIAFGWNDRDEQLSSSLEFGREAKAVVAGGITLWDDELSALEEGGIKPPAAPPGGWRGYGYRRKYFPKDLEQKITSMLRETDKEKALFRRASCAYSYLQGIPDLNAYRREDLKNCTGCCPPEQVARCESIVIPSKEKVEAALKKMDVEGVSFELCEHGIVINPGDSVFGLLDAFALRHLLCFPVTMKGQVQ